MLVPDLCGKWLFLVLCLTIRDEVARNTPSPSDLRGEDERRKVDISAYLFYVVMLEPLEVLCLLVLESEQFRLLK